MRNILFLTSVFLLATACTSTADKMPVEEPISSEATVESENASIFEDSTLGITFEYRTSPNGYILEELPITENDNPELLQAVRLVRIADAEVMAGMDGPTEGAPTINLLVFSASTKSLKEWLLENTYLTNYSEESAQQVTVDGTEAVTYSWEGLYDGKTVAFLHNGNVFLFTGSFYSKIVDDRQADFEQAISSIILK